MYLTVEEINEMTGLYDCQKYIEFNSTIPKDINGVMHFYISFELIRQLQKHRNKKRLPYTVKQLSELFRSSVVPIGSMLCRAEFANVQRVRQGRTVHYYLNDDDLFLLKRRLNKDFKE